MNFLACDLGGTKVLIAIYEKVNNDSPPRLIEKERYLSAEWESIYEITKDFLRNKCKNKYFPKIACFGIAGPTGKNSAKITNLNWEISEIKLKNYFQFEKVELINDFAVLIHGIPFLKSNQFMTLQNNINNNNNYNLGLDNITSQKTFYMNEKDADSSIVEPKKYNSIYQIETITLNKFFQDCKIERIKLLKLEAEGYEPEILLGSNEALRKIEYIAIDGGYERGKKLEETLSSQLNFLLKNNFEIIEINLKWGRALLKNNFGTII